MARVLTAAIGAPLAIAALFLLPRLGFLILVGGLILIAAAEMARLGRAIGAGKGISLLPVFTLLCAILLLEPPFVGLDGSLRVFLMVLLATAGVSLAGLWSGGSIQERSLSASFMGFGALYLALPIAAFDQLRTRDPWLVVLLLATVWLTDTGAFVFGSKWGRRKLAPKVSPNKSWEGALGGLVLGVLAAGLLSWWRLGGIEPSWLVGGLAASVSGQLGDLFESMFKRAAGVKDSGALLPGHGGMFDRLDSLIIAAPVLELTCRLVLPAAS